MNRMVVALSEEDYRRMIEALQAAMAQQDIERKRLEEKIALQLKEKERLQKECDELEETLEIYEEIAREFQKKFAKKRKLDSTQE